VTVNQHGLVRHIPEAVKREVRKRSKNGCVVCRSLVYDYEHIDPAFTDARTHDPEKICLLCPGCHAEVTRGRLAKSQVTRAYERVQSENSVLPPFYHVALSGSLNLGLGNATFQGLQPNAPVIEYDGASILSVEYKHDQLFGCSRPSITGEIRNLTGEILVRLDDNRILLLASGADVEMIGKRLRVTDSDATTILQIVFDPPSAIIFDKLQMKIGDLVCELDSTFGVSYPTIDGSRARCLVDELRAVGARSAISYRSDNKKWETEGRLVIDGRGFVLPMGGARLATGAVQTYIPMIRYWPEAG